MDPQWCPLCKEFEVFRQATVEYQGVKYCEVCQRQWIKPTLRSHERLKSLAPNLRREVKRQGRKFKELASYVGVSSPTVSTYIREPNSALPSLETFVRICEVLGTHPNKLLGFPDPELERLLKERDQYKFALLDIRRVIQGLGWEWVDQPGQWRSDVKASELNLD